MIVLLQRVLEAQVVRRAEGGQAEEPLGAVGRGLLAFVCAEPGDSAAVIHAKRLVCGFLRMRTAA